MNNFEGRFFSSGIKIRIAIEPLSVFCDVFNGLNPGNVRHILLSKEKKTSKYVKMLLGKDIKRYNLSWTGTWVNYDQTLKNQLKPTDTKSKAGMTAQKKVDFALRDENIYLGEKIVVRKTSDHIIGTFDSNEFYYDSLSYGIKLKSKTKISILFILGLLNSKLVNYFHNTFSNNKNKVFAKVLATNISMLPIPKNIIGLKNQEERHSEIIRLVEQLLQLNKEKVEVKLQTKISQIENKIDYFENRINEIVYQLYELTEDEIKIIEST